MLISDLFEGGVEAELRKRVAALLAAGVMVIVLLALSDEGRPAYDHELARSSPRWACPRSRARRSSSRT